MMPAIPVQLPRQIVNQILSHVQADEEREVCGLIAARDGIPCRCHAISNIADRPAVRFVMDPAEQIAALRQMREAGETLFAIYHSHPGSPARPSRTDLQEAGYPDVLYLIVSLSTRGVLEMRGYDIRDGQVEETALEL